jgi:hypothetical protein
MLQTTRLPFSSSCLPFVSDFVLRISCFRKLRNHSPAEAVTDPPLRGEARCPARSSHQSAPAPFATSVRVKTWPRFGEVGFVFAFWRGGHNRADSGTFRHIQAHADASSRTASLPTVPASNRQDVRRQSGVFGHFRTRRATPQAGNRTRQSKVAKDHQRDPPTARRVPPASCFQCYGPSRAGVPVVSPSGMFCSALSSVAFAVIRSSRLFTVYNA